MPSQLCFCEGCSLACHGNFTARVRIALRAADRATLKILVAVPLAPELREDSEKTARRLVMTAPG
jgi:hypothetical protein